jgi:hypothetical protein
LVSRENDSDFLSCGGKIIASVVCPRDYSKSDADVFRFMVTKDLMCLKVDWSVLVVLPDDVLECLHCVLSELTALIV